jgi:hypothetical protein
MKGSANLPDASNDLGNTDAEDVATNQQDVVLPVFAGERTLSAFRIAPA